MLQSSGDNGCHCTGSAGESCHDPCHDYYHDRLSAITERYRGAAELAAVFAHNSG